MIPEAGFGPVLVSPDKQALRAAYRRGQILVYIVVGVTAMFLLCNAIDDLWSNGIHDLKKDHFVDWLLQGLVCWYALRGGQFSSGCLTALYGLFLVPGVMTAIGLVLNVFHPTQPLPNFIGLMGAGIMIGLSVWCAFVVWALLISRDVRLYKEIRRRAVNVPDRDPFEWLPRRRRGRPS